MSYIDDHIREHLDGFITSNYENIPDSFVYQFGPYIAMCPGYEVDVDEIAKHNSIMKFIQVAAYILRGVANKTDRKSITEFLKKTVIEASEEFPGKQYPEEWEALQRIIKHHLSNKASNLNGSESVMTDIAPVVPYNQEIEKPDIFISEPQAVDCVQCFMANNNIGSVLHKLLMNSTKNILNNPLTDEFSPDVLKNIHNLVGYRVDPDAYKYYFLAALYYHNPSKEFLNSVIQFYDGIVNGSEIEDYDAFEALIDNTIQFSTPVLESSWEDPGLDEKDEESVNKMLSDVMNSKVSDNDPDFNITALLNFIALNRYMQFDIFCNRQFIDEFKTTNTENPSVIININHLGENKNAYELNTGILVMPYVDLRDHKVRYIHLKKNSSTPYIRDRIEQY